MPTPESTDPKAPEDTPTVAPVVPEKPAVVTPTSISKRMGEIVAEHGGLVSNIPAVKSHEYWRLKAELDALRATTA